MSSGRLRSIIMAMFVMTMGLALYLVSQEVQRKQRTLLNIERQIDKEARDLRRLETEWAYLNSPSHLIEMNKKMGEDLALLTVKADDQQLSKKPRVLSAQDMKKYSYLKHIHKVALKSVRSKRSSPPKTIRKKEINKKPEQKEFSSLIHELTETQ